MDYTPEELEDLAKMRELRLRLRACAEARVAACEQMELPTNWLDVTRQCRGIMAVDRMVVMLFSPPPKRRTRRSTKSSGSADPLPPPHFPNGEVSAGASRRMTEGFSPAPDSARPLPEALPGDDAEEAELLAALTHKAREGINEATKRCAEWAGVWPDGERFNPEKSGWRKHALTDTLSVPVDDDTLIEAWLHNEILIRGNAIARHAARKAGAWFNGTPYSESDPDYFAMSANYGTGIQHRAAGERKGPPRMAWWFIRKPPP